MWQRLCTTWCTACGSLGGACGQHSCLYILPACLPFLQLDTGVCLGLVLLLCTMASLAPEELRRPMHLWLLTTVARAPLLLQPVLLLCPPVRAAYRRCRCVGQGSRRLSGNVEWLVAGGAACELMLGGTCTCACIVPEQLSIPRRPSLARRDGLLLGLHIAVFVLQYWWPSQLGSTEWLAGGSVLASQPAGLWLLIAVFTLQVRLVGGQQIV